MAEAHYPQPVDSRVYQIVCSPIHQGVPASMRITCSGRHAELQVEQSQPGAHPGEPPGMSTTFQVDLT
jgi:hypothetical protein